jgi:hypothetical protein
VRKGEHWFSDSYQAELVKKHGQNFGLKWL